MKVLLLGSGELGKEVVIELKRYNAYVIAVDRYAKAPAMAVADDFRVLDMTDEGALYSLIEVEQPDFIIPEVEAIATSALKEVQVKFGSKVVPSVKAVTLTMDREGIRRLAAETLGIPTSPYKFASSLQELTSAASEIGYPVVIKPVQSSSGKGQSVVKSAADLSNAWKISQEEARGGGGGVQRVIVEGFVDFDYEITLLTCKAQNGTIFCDPIGHTQVDGDYRLSWQTQPMTAAALSRAKVIAHEITAALADGDEDYGLFGVELFIKGDDVIFSEVSPRPHDTGMVTMISSDISEFAMHARAILGLPVHQPTRLGEAASYAVIAQGHGKPVVENLAVALMNDRTDVRVFGKPEVDGERRVAVALARGETLSIAKSHAESTAQMLNVRVI